MARSHSLSIVVKDLLGLPVSNAEVSLNEDGACINFEANDGRGMLELVLPRDSTRSESKN